MSTVLDTDIFLVQRGVMQYRVVAADLKKAATPPPALRPWTPADIPSNQLLAWLDASDASTITQSANRVSEWRDKAVVATNRRFVQPTGVLQPLWRTSPVNAVGDAVTAGSNLNVEQDAAWPGGALPRPHMVATVHLSRTATAGTSSFLITSTNNPGSQSSVLAEREETVLPSTYVMTNSNTLAGSFSPTITPVNTSFVLAASWGTTFQESRMHVNGTLGVVPAGAAAITPPGALRVGLATTMQAIVVAGLHADLVGVRQRIEGWAAHKYGVAASLPAGHPYRSAPPMI
jgi:hypothetical protein